MNVNYKSNLTGCSLASRAALAWDQLCTILESPIQDCAAMVVHGYAAVCSTIHPHSLPDHVSLEVAPNRLKACGNRCSRGRQKYRMLLMMLLC